MVKFGLISYSNHLLKKIIPSIINNKVIKIEKLFTKSKKKKILTIKKKKIKALDFNNFFLSKYNFDYIYISSKNQDHYSDIIKSLSISKNIICEKPLCLSTKELKKVYSIAEKKKSRVFEMIQYIHHPVFIKLQNLIKVKTIGQIEYVESNFCIPIFFNKKNFRFFRKKGGGALYDVGFYPISILFTLFNTKKIKLLKKSIKYKNQVDINGNIIVQDFNKRIFNLNWGFETNYKNNLMIIGSKGSINIDFIFSKKIKQKCLIVITKGKKIRKIKTDNANQINLAFESIINSKQYYYKYRKNLTFKIMNFMEKIIKS